MAIRVLGVDCRRSPSSSVAPLRRRVAFLAALSACSLAGVAVSLRYADAFGPSVASSASDSVVAWASPEAVSAVEPPLPRALPSPVVFEQDHVGCLRYQWQLLSRHRENSRLMTPYKCVHLCYERGYEYAALMGGATCHCSAWTGAGQVQLPIVGGARRCGVPCAGNPAMRCGGGGEYADVYSTRNDGGGGGDDQDGVDEVPPWTVWMTAASRFSKDSAGTDYASRYRECRRSPETSHLAPASAAAAETAHRCVTAVQRRVGGRVDDGGGRAAGAATAELRAELNRYVGCFVFGREPAGTTEASIAAGSSNGGGGSSGASPLVCLSLCAARPAAYALVTAHDGRCRCANSLGVARPFYRCGAMPPGVAVYVAAFPATSPIAVGEAAQGSMQLTFDAPPRRRHKVLLLVHGGGSRSLLLSRLLAADERVTHAVEPERTVFGDVVDTRSAATARASMSRLLTRYLSCDAQRLPAVWLASVGAPKSAYELCRRYHAASGEPCIAAYRAACEASSVVSASSALLTDAEALRQFVAENNDTIVFLVARDPLAVAALLKKSLLRRGSGRSAARITASRATALCAAMKQTRAAAVQLARGGSAVHRVHFEYTDDDVAAVALGFYRRLRLRRGGGGSSSYDVPEADERERVLRLAARLVNRTDASSIAAAAGSSAMRHGPATADDVLPTLSAQEQRVVEEACAGFVYGE